MNDGEVRLAAILAMVSLAGLFAHVYLEKDEEFVYEKSTFEKSFKTLKYKFNRAFSVKTKSGVTVVNDNDSSLDALKEMAEKLDADINKNKKLIQLIRTKNLKIFTTFWLTPPGERAAYIAHLERAKSIQDDKSGYGMTEDDFVEMYNFQLFNKASKSERDRATRVLLNSEEFRKIIANYNLSQVYDCHYSYTNIESFNPSTLQYVYFTYHYTKKGDIVTKESLVPQYVYDAWQDEFQLFGISKDEVLNGILGEISDNRFESWDSKEDFLEYLQKTSNAKYVGRMKEARLIFLTEETSIENLAKDPNIEFSMLNLYNPGVAYMHKKKLQEGLRFSAVHKYANLLPNLMLSLTLAAISRAAWDAYLLGLTSTHYHLFFSTSINMISGYAFGEYLDFSSFGRLSGMASFATNLVVMDQLGLPFALANAAPKLKRNSTQRNVLTGLTMAAIIAARYYASGESPEPDCENNPGAAPIACATQSVQNQVLKNVPFFGSPVVAALTQSKMFVINPKPTDKVGRMVHQVADMLISRAHFQKRMDDPEYKSNFLENTLKVTKYVEDMKFKNTSEAFSIGSIAIGSAIGGPVGGAMGAAGAFVADSFLVDKFSEIKSLGIGGNVSPSVIIKNPLQKAAYFTTLGFNLASEITGNSLHVDRSMNEYKLEETLVKMWTMEYMPHQKNAQQRNFFINSQIYLLEGAMRESKVSLVMDKAKMNINDILGEIKNQPASFLNSGMYDHFIRGLKYKDMYDAVVQVVSGSPEDPSKQPVRQTREAAAVVQRAACAAAFHGVREQVYKIEDKVDLDKYEDLLKKEITKSEEKLAHIEKVKDHNGDGGILSWVRNFMHFVEEKDQDGFAKYIESRIINEQKVKERLTNSLEAFRKARKVNAEVGWIPYDAIEEKINDIKVEPIFKVDKRIADEMVRCMKHISLDIPRTGKSEEPIVNMGYVDSRYINTAQNADYQTFLGYHNVNSKMLQFLESGETETSAPQLFAEAMTQINAAVMRKIYRSTLHNTDDNDLLKQELKDHYEAGFNQVAQDCDKADEIQTRQDMTRALRLTELGNDIAANEMIGKMSFKKMAAVTVRFKSAFLEKIQKGIAKSFRTSVDMDNDYVNRDVRTKNAVRKVLTSLSALMKDDPDREKKLEIFNSRHIKITRATPNQTPSTEGGYALAKPEKFNMSDCKQPYTECGLGRVLQYIYTHTGETQVMARGVMLAWTDQLVYENFGGIVTPYARDSSPDARDRSTVNLLEHVASYDTFQNNMSHDGGLSHRGSTTVNAEQELAWNSNVDLFCNVFLNSLKQTMTLFPPAHFHRLIQYEHNKTYKEFLINHPHVRTYLEAYDIPLCFADGKVCVETLARDVFSKKFNSHTEMISACTESVTKISGMAVKGDPEYDAALKNHELWNAKKHEVETPRIPGAILWELSKIIDENNDYNPWLDGGGHHHEWVLEKNSIKKTLESVRHHISLHKENQKSLRSQLEKLGGQVKDDEKVEFVELTNRRNFLQAKLDHMNKELDELKASYDLTQREECEQKKGCTEKMLVGNEQPMITEKIRNLETEIEKGNNQPEAPLSEGSIKNQISLLNIYLKDKKLELDNRDVIVNDIQEEETSIKTQESLKSELMATLAIVDDNLRNHQFARKQKLEKNIERKRYDQVEYMAVLETIAQVSLNTLNPHPSRMIDWANKLAPINTITNLKGPDQIIHIAKRVNENATSALRGFTPVIREAVDPDLESFQSLPLSFLAANIHAAQSHSKLGPLFNHLYINAKQSALNKPTDIITGTFEIVKNHYYEHGFVEDIISTIDTVDQNVACKARGECETTAVELGLAGTFGGHILNENVTLKEIVQGNNLFNTEKSTLDFKTNPKNTGVFTSSPFFSFDTLGSAFSHSMIFGVERGEENLHGPFTGLTVKSKQATKKNEVMGNALADQFKNGGPIEIISYASRLVIYNAWQAMANTFHDAMGPANAVMGRNENGYVIPFAKGILTIPFGPKIMAWRLAMGLANEMFPFNNKEKMDFFEALVSYVIKMEQRLTIQAQINARVENNFLDDCAILLTHYPNSFQLGTCEKEQKEIVDSCTKRLREEIIADTELVYFLNLTVSEIPTNVIWETAGKKYKEGLSKVKNQILGNALGTGVGSTVGMKLGTGFGGVVGGPLTAAAFGVGGAAMGAANFNPNNLRDLANYWTGGNSNFDNLSKENKRLTAMNIANQCAKVMAGQAKHFRGLHEAASKTPWAPRHEVDFYGFLEGQHQLLSGVLQSTGFAFAGSSNAPSDGMVYMRGNLRGTRGRFSNARPDGIPKRGNLRGTPKYVEFPSPSEESISFAQNLLLDSVQQGTLGLLSDAKTVLGCAFNIAFVWQCQIPTQNKPPMDVYADLQLKNEATLKNFDKATHDTEVSFNKNREIQRTIEICEDVFENLGWLHKEISDIKNENEFESNEQYLNLTTKETREEEERCRNVIDAFHRKCSTVASNGLPPSNFSQAVKFDIFNPTTHLLQSIEESRYCNALYSISKQINEAIKRSENKEREQTPEGKDTQVALNSFQEIAKRQKDKAFRQTKEIGSKIINDLSGYITGMMQQGRKFIGDTNAYATSFDILSQHYEKQEQCLIVGKTAVELSKLWKTLHKESNWVSPEIFDWRNQVREVENLMLTKEVIKNFIQDVPIFLENDDGYPVIYYGFAIEDLSVKGVGNAVNFEKAEELIDKMSVWEICEYNVKFGNTDFKNAMSTYILNIRAARSEMDYTFIDKSDSLMGTLVTNAEVECRALDGVFYMLCDAKKEIKNGLEFQQNSKELNVVTMEEDKQMPQWLTHGQGNNIFTKANLNETESFIGMTKDRRRALLNNEYVEPWESFCKQIPLFLQEGNFKYLDVCKCILKKNTNAFTINGNAHYPVGGRAENHEGVEAELRQSAAAKKDMDDAERRAQVANATEEGGVFKQKSKKVKFIKSTWKDAREFVFIDGDGVVDWEGGKMDMKMDTKFATEILTVTQKSLENSKFIDYDPIAIENAIYLTDNLSELNDASDVKNYCTYIKMIAEILDEGYVYVEREGLSLIQDLQISYDAMCLSAFQNGMGEKEEEMMKRYKQIRKYLLKQIFDELVEKTQPLSIAAEEAFDSEKLYIACHPDDRKDFEEINKIKSGNKRYFTSENFHDAHFKALSVYSSSQNNVELKNFEDFKKKYIEFDKTLNDLNNLSPNIDANIDDLIKYNAQKESLEFATAHDDFISTYSKLKEEIGEKFSDDMTKNFLTAFEVTDKIRNFLKTTLKPGETVESKIEEIEKRKVDIKQKIRELKDRDERLNYPHFALFQKHLDLHYETSGI